MRIGIDASRANAQQRTGTEWYSFHVIDQLKKIIPDTYEVVLYSKEPLRDDLSALPGHWESKVLNWPPKFMWTQLRLSLEMLFHRPDMLYIPAHTIPFIHPKRLAVVVHDVGFERQDELYDDQVIGYNNSIAKKLINVAVRLFTRGKYSATEMDYHRFSTNMALEQASKLITVSDFSKSEMQQVYDVKSKRVVVIPNGYNDRSGNTDGDDAVLRSKNIEKPYVLYVGRLEQKKNVEALVQAFAEVAAAHTEIQLVLAGSPGFNYEKIKRAIKKSGVKDRIIETGWLEDEELNAIMRQARAFTLVSHYEGFGIPVLEAMRVGVPVLCSRIAPLQEVAADAAVYTDPNDANEMALQLERVLINDGLRAGLIEKGKERSSDFSWKRTALETWYVIDTVLHEK